MNDYEEVREKFFGFLLRKPCTHKQAEEYLQRQRVSGDVFTALMNEAEDTGLIDDLTFAKLFAEGHLNWGNMKIAHELGMRGVSKGDIETALDEAEDESVRAREIAEGWRRSGVEERKIAARLTARGFTGRAVRSASE